MAREVGPDLVHDFDGIRVHASRLAASTLERCAVCEHHACKSLGHLAARGGGDAEEQDAWPAGTGCHMHVDIVMSLSRQPPVESLRPFAATPVFPDRR